MNDKIAARIGSPLLAALLTARGIVLGAVLVASTISACWAQGTLDDYKRATLFRNAKKLVSLAEVRPNWIG